MSVPEMLEHVICYISGADAVFVSSDAFERLERPEESGLNCPETKKVTRYDCVCRQRQGRHVSERLHGPAISSSKHGSSVTRLLS